MTQDVESIYDEYISKLKQAMPNVDPDFSHRIMYLERKLADEDTTEPDVSAVIEYKAGTDLDKKVGGLRAKYSVEVEYADKKDTLHVMSRMKMAKIKEISADMDIAKITGKADPGYGE
ncbi:MAG TPA: hypothetical protein VJ771_00885 [Candidatus Nitrosotalea sp.]|nr:hypothetical protein [Candidatus Nitrosotalea sp.]